MRVSPELRVLQASESFFIPEHFSWEHADVGIEYAFFENRALPVRYHIVKIDVHSGAFCIKAYPTPNDTLPVTKISIEQFAKKNSCVVAFNTTPFSRGFFTTYPVGVHKTEQKTISPAVSRYAVLAFKTEAGADGRPALQGSIFETQDEAELWDYEWAFGGFFTILKDGKYISFSAKSANSRTAVGLSPDGGILYILCVEGEQRHQSAGLSYEQCAHIFVALGCTDALQFDGGGSTQLFVKGKDRLFSYTVLRHIPACIGFSPAATP